VLLISLLLYGERGRILRRSSRKILSKSGLRNVLNLKLLKLYLYGRWTKNYIGFQKKRILPKMQQKKKQGWADRTHFKVLTPENAGSIISVEQNISLQNQEQIIPYATARDIVLNGPPDIVVYECGCRHSSPNPCQPTQVCLVIGEPFTGFVLDHHPKSSRRISREEAHELVQTEHKRGHFQSAWFKDICLDRFYAICNCCKCCCLGTQAVTKHGIPMAASSGYVAQVDDSLCSACSLCEEACPFNAIGMEETAQVSWEKCLGCGVCVGQCPEAALTLVREEKKGVPMDAKLLQKA
jgi:Pyruvate/2-oxoacid:ferredoxin oxidoreductase delta subunit